MGNPIDWYLSAGDVGVWTIGRLGANRMDLHHHWAIINWRCLLVLAAVKKIALVATHAGDYAVFKNASSQWVGQRLDM